jgi:hypothetical protein
MKILNSHQVGIIAIIKEAIKNPNKQLDCRLFLNANHPDWPKDKWNSKKEFKKLGKRLGYNIKLLTTGYLKVVKDSKE